MSQSPFQVFFISQIVFGIYLLSEGSQVEVLAHAGATLHIFSGVIFGMLPCLSFAEKADCKKEKSYIHSTKIVDTEIYSVVRHPQYLTFIIFALSGIMLFQH